MKKLLSLCLCVAMLLGLATGAVSEGAAEGVYTASGAGFGGTLTVEVTVGANGIQSITTPENHETATVGGAAIEQLSASVVSLQSLAVDGVSGATVSSTAFLALTEDCLTQAGADIAALKAPVAVGEQALRFTPGEYEATVDGFGGPLTVKVGVSEDAIETIETPVNPETVSIGTTAIELMTEEILSNQTLAVDAASGATITSGAFLQGVRECLLSAGGDLVSLTRKAQTDTAEGETVKLDADIVVVGAGLAGLSAAVRATELGARVVILEKLSITGGSSRTSLGSYLVCECDENEGYHVTDEADTLSDAIARWKKYQATSLRESEYPDYDRLSFQLVQSMFTIDWLKNWGATFAPKTPIAERGMAMVQVDIPDLEGGTPAGRLLRRLKSVALEQGAQLYLDTRATELMLDGGGAIAGVKATTKTGEMEIAAQRVILACGGYSESPEMIAELIPEAGECTTIGSAGNSGDGIVMAREVGAALWENQWVHACWPGPTKAFRSVNPYAMIFMDSTSPLPIAESSYYRLMVDKDGERFMNEAGHYSAQLLNMVSHADGPYWSLYDGLTGQAQEIAESGLSTGDVVKGDTIAELAEQLGMDASVLEATVTRYNEMCAAGADADFNKPATHLKAIGEGPYYMIHMLPGACDTLGGVKTDYDQRVLREDETAIPGLYAVGATTNGVYYNQSYFSGSQLTFASSTGKIAAETAVNEMQGADLQPAA